MNKKQLFRFLGFLLVLILVFTNLFRVFNISNVNNPGTAEINTFYHQPEDTIDVALLGASSIYRGWSAMESWNHYGMTSFAWSTAAQPLQAAKYIIEDILKTQSPKVFVIDYRMVRQGSRLLTEGYIRKVSDNMPFSKNRFDAINAMLDASELEPRYNRFEYYFNFLLYHSRWEEGLNSYDFSTKHNPYMGTYISSANFKVKKMTPLSQPTNDTLSLTDETEQALIDLCEYLVEKKLPVVFTNIPYNAPEEDRKKLNTAESIIESYGFPCLDLNDHFDEIGLDFKTDYYNYNHTNINGMTKVTHYLSKYLKDHYELPDHRTDPDFSEWNDAYARYKEHIIQRAQKHDFIFADSVIKSFQ